jgi:hypothetical protein
MMNKVKSRVSFFSLLATGLVLLYAGTVSAQDCLQGLPIKCPGEAPSLSCTSSTDLCNLEKSCPGIIGRADGCSTPLYDGISAKFKEVFEAACNDHDRCYSTPGMSKGTCDINFKNRMISLCEKPGTPGYTPGLLNVGCRTVATTWDDAVLTAAGTSFAGDQTWAEKNCPCDAACKDSIVMNRVCTKNNQGERCYQDSTKQYGQCGITGLTPDCKPSQVNCDENCQDRARVCNKSNQGQRCYQQSTNEFGTCGMTGGFGDCKPPK